MIYHQGPFFMSIQNLKSEFAYFICVMCYGLICVERCPIKQMIQCDMQQVMYIHKGTVDICAIPLATAVTSP